jgi:hypothetical protein
MHLRKWAKLLALAGVLFHAAFVVRHNGIVLVAATQSPDTLAAAPGAICQIGNQYLPLEASLSPNQDQPTPTKQQCPICSGLVSAFVLAATEVTVCVPQHRAAPATVLCDQCVIPPSRLRPSGRGPPVSL